MIKDYAILRANLGWFMTIKRLPLQKSLLVIKYCSCRETQNKRMK